jgi:hypothetical protein
MGMLKEKKPLPLAASADLMKLSVLFCVETHSIGSGGAIKLFFELKKYGRI